ncbi:MAG: hypothetical protein E7663_07365 [Ruminococcaceae bacterium]|nr:hypothetical protein [Oscillospiraceae bacterium]
MLLSDIRTVPLNEKDYPPITKAINKLCTMLSCRIGDVMEYLPDEAEAP